MTEAKGKKKPIIIKSCWTCEKWKECKVMNTYCNLSQWQLKKDGYVND